MLDRKKMKATTAPAMTTPAIIIFREDMIDADAEAFAACSFFAAAEAVRFAV